MLCIIDSVLLNSDIRPVPEVPIQIAPSLALTTAHTMLSGFHNVVLLRHGEYLTVYAGLATLDVRKGQRVGAGESLGTLFTEAGENTSRLHFEDGGLAPDGHRQTAFGGGKACGEVGIGEKALEPCSQKPVKTPRASISKCVTKKKNSIRASGYAENPAATGL